MRIQRPLPGVAEIGGADLRLVIIRQVAHFAEGVVTLPVLGGCLGLLQERPGGIQYGGHGAEVIGQEISQHGRNMSRWCRWSWRSARVRPRATSHSLGQQEGQIAAEPVGVVVE